HTAACNSANEIYPRGMEAVRALKLSQSALTGRIEIGDAELKALVGGRYPAAQELPAHPFLDSLVEQAGLVFEWSPDANRKKGAYVNRYRRVLATSSGSSSLERSDTISGQPPSSSENAQTAEQFEQR